MQRERANTGAKLMRRVTIGLIEVIAMPFLVAILALLSGCATDLLVRKDSRPPVPAPVVDRAAASETLVSGYLENLRRLVQSAPAEQAEMAAAAQREYDLAPTPSHQLRLALVLATPNHAATDLPRAQRLLRELMAAPAALLPAERALAFLEQQKVDVQLFQQADAVHLVHAQVGDHEVGAEAARGGECLHAALDRFDVVVLRAQADGEQTKQARIVVDHQDACLAFAGLVHDRIPSILGINGRL